MKKIILIAVLVAVSLSLSAQNNFSLNPKNIANHIGKTTKADFEVLVGEPDDSHESMDMIATDGTPINVYVYNVYNTYIEGTRSSTPELQAIFCVYRNDGKLARLWLTDIYPARYRIDFYGLFEVPPVPGYDKTKTIVRKDNFGNVIYYKYFATGMTMEQKDFKTLYGAKYGTIIFNVD